MRVAWVGPRPAWVEQDEAKAELEGIELEWIEPGSCGSPPDAPDLLHVTWAALRKPGVAGGLPAGVPIVADLTGEGDTAVEPSEASLLRRAASVAVDSSWEREALRSRVGTELAVAVATRPLDLDRFAPEERLAEAKGRGRDLRRFRRFHRLAGPVVLFAGPYTEAGGLDRLLEVVHRLRGEMPELRLAAIPHGSSSPRYRDRCEMEALDLGHRGIVEWAPAAADVPFWYAVATVVCLPAREPVSPEPAKRAAAAGRPFVGSDLGSIRAHVDDGATGILVPADDLDALQASLEELLRSEGEADRLGGAARLKAEAGYGPAAAASGLRAAWTDVLERRAESAPRVGLA